MNDRDDMYTRSRALIGDAGLKKLAASKVAVFGIGGVGGYVCEALARSGVGYLMLIDNDSVDITNMNRQIVALHSTLGRKKTQVMKSRIFDINPDVQVDTRELFYMPDSKGEMSLTEYDYVIDAVDTVTAKVLLASECFDAEVPIISSMGTGNKMDPTGFKVCDVYETSVCPLAKVMRKELKKLGIPKLKVVYSAEEPMKSGGRTPGSLVFVPAVAGFIIAGEVIKTLINDFA